MYYHCISFLVAFLKFACPGVSYCLTFSICFICHVLFSNSLSNSSKSCEVFSVQSDTSRNQSVPFLLQLLWPPALAWATFLLAAINTWYLGNGLHLFSVLYYLVSFIRILSLLVLPHSDIAYILFPFKERVKTKCIF